MKAIYYIALQCDVQVSGGYISLAYIQSISPALRQKLSSSFRVR
jgi:hypothetical protein